MNISAAALGLAIVAVPLAAPADTQFVRNVPVSDHWFQSVYVHTGTSVDIALVPGDALNSQAVVADPRWNMTTFNAGPQSTPHIILKPSAALPQKQLLTIPGAKHDYHVLLQSGDGESTAYTLMFFEPGGPRRSAAAAPVPAAAPKLATVTTCVGTRTAPLFSNYKMTGDPRISIGSVCDDGTRTYVILNRGRGLAVVPYRVDAAGKQDQIVNAVFDPTLNEWVFEGTYDRLAMLADSSRGQIRVNIEREKAER